jgi:hypothetical protein
MAVDGKSFRAAIAECLGSLGLALRAAMSIPLESGAADPSQGAVDSNAEAQRWYRHISPGFLTRNGLGSLEIGAEND